MGKAGLSVKDLLSTPLTTGGATVWGATVKSTPCDTCVVHYYHPVVAFEHKRFNDNLDPEEAQATARKEASSQVRKQLRENQGDVPCPQCGTYPDVMVKQIIARATDGARGVGAMIAAIGAVFALSTGIEFALDKGGVLAGGWGVLHFPDVWLWSLIAGPLSIGGAIVVLAPWLAGFDDPNRESLEERRSRAERLALAGEGMTQEDSERVLHAIEEDTIQLIARDRWSCDLVTALVILPILVAVFALTFLGLYAALKRGLPRSRSIVVGIAAVGYAVVSAMLWWRVCKGVAFARSDPDRPIYRLDDASVAHASKPWTRLVLEGDS